jgi:hypothetical protein
MSYELSRRAVIGSLAASPIMPAGLALAKSTLVDAKLTELGRQFHELVTQFDDQDRAPAYFTDEFFTRLNRVEAEILSTPARSIEGYRVKARAACWALLGDIDPHSGTTTDRRMALSIVRDLIQQYDPELEQPGALAKLVSHE